MNFIAVANSFLASGGDQLDGGIGSGNCSAAMIAARLLAGGERGELLMAKLETAFFRAGGDDFEAAMAMASVARRRLGNDPGQRLMGNSNSCRPGG